ncbi:MAG: hypothetical protein EXQ47_06130 [Bryobacterales bacterium]|nr:hypothetical protein [Bryobacterales bacterium]
MPTPRKSNYKAAIVTVVFGVVMMGIIAYETMGLRQVECEVCMEFEGRKKCLLVKGESEENAMQTAKDNACSFITNGRAEGFRCSSTPPASVKCMTL